MNHSFNVEIATKYGFKESVILEHLFFWIKKNEANNENFFDGKYWTYNSIKAFADLFPYFTEKQIRSALDSLCKQGLICKGNYNKSAYDRTLWYALTDKAIDFYKGKSICQKKEIDLPKKANEFTPQGEPIPDINTDINTDNKTLLNEENDDFVDVSGWDEKAFIEYKQQLFDYFWKFQIKKVSKKDAEKAWDKIFSPLKNSKQLMYDMAKQIMRGIKGYIPIWKLMAENNDSTKIPYPATWLNGRRWEDDLTALMKEYESKKAEYERKKPQKQVINSTILPSKRDIWVE